MATPRRRRRGFPWIPKKVWIPVATLVVLVGGGWWYLNAPDLPSGGPLTVLPNVGLLASKLPIVGTGSRKANPPLAGEQAIRDRALAALANTPEAKTEAQVRQALASTGLPITAVDVTMTPGGKTTLVVGLDASKLVNGGAFDAGLAAGVGAVVQLAKSKSLDLGATEQVVIAVADSRGRPLFGIAARSSAITQFRDGKISQRDFLKTTAIKADSRMALIDAMRSMAAH